jgi:hypothetical protein
MARALHFRRRVYVGATLVVAGIAGWGAWSQRAARETAGPARPPEPFVRVGAAAGAGSELLREKADIFDPAPLFVPTERNYSQRGLPAALVKQPGGVFGDFGAKLSFAEGGLTPYALEAPSGADSLPEILARNNEAPFSGLGEVDAARNPLAVRAALVRINLLGSNEIKDIDLAGAVPPRTDFPPLEFLVLVGSAGLIGEPVIAQSSGSEDVDGFFLQFLTRTARLGAVLAPGRYRVTVGP